MINKESNMAIEYVKEGGVSKYKVLDFHAHMGNLVNAYMPFGSPEKMLYLMDRSNVRCALFSSHHDLTVGNRFILDEIEICKKHPGRFKLYMTVFSRHCDFKEDIKIFEKYREHFVGFKLHPSYSGIMPDHSLNRPYLEYADAHGLLVLGHTWSGLEMPYENVLKKYKNLKLIGGHCFYDNWRFTANLALNYENFYPELTAVLFKRGALEEMVSICGANKILFGCDMPWFSYTYYIGALLSAEITDQQREDILWNNGYVLLKDQVRDL
jgi:predicted TIM-barrel fold metal-dependent hydrolase